MIQPIGLTGVAAMDLGLGSVLKDQVKDETDDERKRRQRLQGEGYLASLLGGGGVSGGPGSY